MLKEFHLAQPVVRNNSARCFQQKLKDAFGELQSGFIRVTMRYAATQPHRILLILRLATLLANHRVVIRKGKFQVHV